MRTIPIVNSDLVALVDDADYDALNQFAWYVHHGSDRLCYAIRMTDDGGSLLMHREILQLSPDQETDHRDNNGLNNQRANLRIGTRSQNGQNARKHRDAKHSIYKGVCWNKQKEAWQASIKLPERRLFLGIFKTQREAGLAYNTAARKYFGEFARLNHVPDTPTPDDPPVPRPTFSSSYRGVCWNKRQLKWVAYIDKDKQRTNLGVHDSEEAAARTYDAAARQLYGPEARLNFPD
jgi:hypothetical protein